MIRRVVLVVCLVLTGLVVARPVDATQRAAYPYPSAAVQLQLRGPLDSTPHGALAIKGTLADGGRFELGGSVKLIGTLVSRRNFETTAIRVRFVLRTDGRDGLPTGKVSVTFNEPYNLRPGTTSLGLVGDELDQLLAGLDDQQSTSPRQVEPRRQRGKVKPVQYDGHVTRIRARTATGSGAFIGRAGSDLVAAGGIVTLLGERVSVKQFRVERVRLKFFGTYGGARRKGTFTITLTQPEVLTRGLSQLYFDNAEAAQFYDAMAT